MTVPGGCDAKALSEEGQTVTRVIERSFEWRGETCLARVALGDGYEPTWRGGGSPTSAPRWKLRRGNGELFTGHRYMPGAELRPWWDATVWCFAEVLDVEVDDS